MNRKEKIIINLMFLAFVLPVVGLLVYGYTKVVSIVQKNPLNPLGLQIDCYVYQNKIIFNLLNPSNESYQISITDIRIRGSYANPAIVTSGSFIGRVISIPSNSSVQLEYDFSLNNNIMNIVRTWEKLGGGLTISMDYEDLKKGLSGVLICSKP
ncbi:hypothetical protein BA065_01620 [Nanoarchaeota archaeon NZ13-N]|nr:MAG: hypothetical protein BA065_01620 [Nanoarchaeota archaeon NZ13-N]